MKTLELKLKKDVLIVNLENESAGFINGDYEFLCDGSELTEGIASELVENKTKHKFENKVLTFYNCKNLESFISAVESKGFYWLENPIGKPINYDLWAKYGDYTHYGKVLTEKCLKWKEAEEKTFKNPLIFVKK